jgi:hypothetical protein
MTKLCFIDTETTSLRPDRRAWDIAVIVREDGKPDVEHQWFVSHGDLDLGNADGMALKIGKFYDRHPQANYRDDAWHEVMDEDEVLQHVEAITRSAHLVGAVPNFDAEVLAARMRAHGLCPAWNYHLIDVEALIVGYVAHKAKTLREKFPDTNFETWPPLPWKSDALAEAVGVKVREEDRHTALGDARWVRDIYDAVIDGTA